MTDIYSNDEASKIKKQVKKINLVNENRKANSRRDADDLKFGIEIDQLLNHDDKLYYESLLD